MRSQGKTNSEGVGKLGRRLNRRGHEEEAEEDIPTERLPYAKLRGLESVQSNWLMMISSGCLRVVFVGEVAEDKAGKCTKW